MMMKRSFVAALLAVAVVFLAGSVASAADMQGPVKTIQVKERVLTLSDGTQLHWTESVTVADIKEGTKVKVTYEPKDGQLVMTKIEVIK